MKTLRLTAAALLFTSTMVYAGESTAPSADNTSTNRRDRKDGEPTADQQKNNKTDVDLTAQIRRSIMKDKSLSVSAHNVKIIAQNGGVTLKGPVRTDAEKITVEKKASEIAGAANVKSEIEIKP